MRHNHLRSGFSLLELLLAVSIMAILAIMTIGLSANAIERNRLRSAESIIIQSIRRAHSRAQNNMGNAKWGVYLCGEPDCTDTDPQASGILFSRNAYTTLDAENDTIYEIGRAASFSGSLYWQQTAGKVGLVFNQLTGTPNYTGTIVVNLGFGERVITVNEEGIVD